MRDATYHTLVDDRKRWPALHVVCLAILMISLDGTVLSVALPSIKVSLGLSSYSLVWVIDAYLITFGGFGMLGGRLGDLFGHRKLFVRGIAIFTLASACCAFANSPEQLVLGRLLQGLGGAVAVGCALPLIIMVFADGSERAKAVGYISFVLSSGGIAGLLLGGTLTGEFNWRWIFLVNFPLGIIACIAGVILLPENRDRALGGHMDVIGALTMTTSSILLVCSTLELNMPEWKPLRTGMLLGSAAGLAALFVRIETRARAPVMPLHIFRNRDFAISLVISLLITLGNTAQLYTSFYLQLVLNYNPIAVGFTYLPSSLTAAMLSLWLPAKLIARFGIRRPLMTGLLLQATGLILFTQTSVGGSASLDVIPGTLMLAVGGAISGTPIILVIMREIASHEAGIASGIVTTQGMIGGALSFAILTSVAAVRARELSASGVASPLALNSGYHVVFFIGSIFVISAIIVTAACRSYAANFKSVVGSNGD